MQSPTQEPRNVQLVRMFGWNAVALLVAFLVNNVLMLAFGLQDFRTLLRPEALTSYGQLLLFALAIIWATGWVLRTAGADLEDDAQRLDRANAFVVRALFFSILFVGIGDALIAFLRVEGLLSPGLDATMKRSQSVVSYVHAPLMALGVLCALWSRSLGFVWLALLIVVAELLIVISRFVFSYEQPFMGDLVRYWYAALLLLSAAYTLLKEGHVRVDVLYATMPPRRQARVNSIGAILFGMTTCWVILLISMGSKHSIINSPIANFEVSQAGSSGMFVKYQMAALLGVFAATMMVQFVSMLFHAVGGKHAQHVGDDILMSAIPEEKV